MGTFPFEKLCTLFCKNVSADACCDKRGTNLWNKFCDHTSIALLSSHETQGTLVLPVAYFIQLFCIIFEISEPVFDSVEYFFFLHLSQFRDDLLKKLKIYILQTPNHLQGMSIG